MSKHGAIDPPKGEVSPDLLREIIRAAKQGKLQPDGLQVLSILRGDAIEEFILARRRNTRYVRGDVNAPTPIDVESLLRRCINGQSPTTAARIIGINKRTARHIWAAFLKDASQTVNRSTELISRRERDRQALAVQCEESHGRRWKDGNTLLMKDDENRLRQVDPSSYRSVSCDTCSERTELAEGV